MTHSLSKSPLGPLSDCLSDCLHRKNQLDLELHITYPDEHISNYLFIQKHRHTSKTSDLYHLSSIFDYVCVNLVEDLRFYSGPVPFKGQLWHKMNLWSNNRLVPS